MDQVDLLQIVVLRQLFCRRPPGRKRDRRRRDAKQGQIHARDSSGGIKEHYREEWLKKRARVMGLGETDALGSRGRIHVPRKSCSIGGDAPGQKDALGIRGKLGGNNSRCRGAGAEERVQIEGMGICAGGGRTLNRPACVGEAQKGPASTAVGYVHPAKQLAGAMPIHSNYLWLAPKSHHKVGIVGDAVIVPGAVGVDVGSVDRPNANTEQIGALNGALNVENHSRRRATSRPTVKAMIGKVGLIVWHRLM
ncbi:hypothetical protein DFH07DRAFT_777016 [Mycena maculata]|uniref:Uncharacterized protein n=1 Tax=Mycena maculata TaxID=230809 RepID=A0AAD7ILW5_9AGAR|nr:hypothetical protein DFH07DRAFT_777016 [Mycena maculata]